MLAHAEIHDGEDKKAESYLRNVLSMLENNHSPNSRYLKLHVKGILNLIGREVARDFSDEASKIQCSPRLKRWFPVRNPTKTT